MLRVYMQVRDQTQYGGEDDSERLLWERMDGGGGAYYEQLILEMGHQSNIRVFSLT